MLPSVLRAAIRPARRSALVRQASAAVRQEASPPSSYVEFARAAREDVLAVAEQPEASWAERLHCLSVISLDLWPREAPHWRVAADVALPSSAASWQSQLSSALAVDEPGADGKRKEGTSRGLEPLERAACLRALSAAVAGPKMARRITPLLAALTDGGGVSGSQGGLAQQLPLDELLRCVCALASATSPPRPDTPLGNFVEQAAQRLSSTISSLQLEHLCELRAALQRCKVDITEADHELRRRLQALAAKQAEGGDAGPFGEDLRVATQAVQLLGETGVMRGTSFRESLLPAYLQAGTAARLLRHLVPLEGATSGAHTFAIAMVAGKIVLGSRQLDVREISAALHGVLSLQSHGETFPLQQGARVLRALWPHTCKALDHMDPSEVSTTVRAYWWQLLYFRQELAVSGVARNHPVVDITLQGRSRAGVSHAKEAEATESMKTKLLHPVLARISEMTLKHTGEVLSVIAPPVQAFDVLSNEDRQAVSKALAVAFPVGGALPQSSEINQWWPDFWSGELASLSGAELLELACGLREADPRLMDKDIAGSNWWVLDGILAELRTQLTGSQRPQVELSHALLLRMCRVMDVWQGHEIEAVLQHLLSKPEAMRPLPTPHFIAVLTALGRWSVPRELPLRLVAAFLDSVDRGDRLVPAAQWADVLRAVREVEEPASRERVTARILQRLVPHLQTLTPLALASALESLAARPPPPAAMRAAGGGASGTYGALARAPAEATTAAQRAIDAGHWDFHQLVGALDSLGKLGWYSDGVVSAALGQCTQTPLLEAHAQLLFPLARACVALRIHHAPLLHKMVLWYGWCNAYLRPKPLPDTQVEELIHLSEQFCELSFHSLELVDILTENLKNPNASPRQVLAILALMARFSHFPPEFKEACARICSGDSAQGAGGADLASLSTQDLVNAFNIHLCAVFDGPAALKHWLTEDEDMKRFFQVHTSQKWYQKQDRDRTTFLQSSAFISLKQAAEDEGLDLRPSDAGEVYHVELTSADAKERLSTWSTNPPTAVVCLKSREQLRWYVPITAEGAPKAEQLQNRSWRFPFMYRGAVQKVRHLQSMGYKVAVVWMHEWNRLSNDEERRAYLRNACGASGRGSTAFSPAAEEDAYE